MLEKIASGEGFDLVDGVRALAKEVLLLRCQGANATPNMAVGAGPTMSERHAFYGVFDTKVAEALLKNGYADIEEVHRATDQELKGISGIGPQTLKQIREAVG